MKMLSKAILVFLISFSTLACGKSDIEKSKAFIANGEFPPAIALLRKQISETPENAEAHFLLGVAYLSTDQLPEADERFANAFKLNPDYGFDIGGKYVKTGEAELKAGNTDQAIRLFQSAVRYRPSLNKTVAKSTYEKGKELARAGKDAQAMRLHQYAIATDPLLGKNMGKWYAVKAEQADAPSEKADLLRLASQFTATYRKEAEEIRRTAAKEEAEKSAMSIKARMKTVMEQRLDVRAWERIASQGLKVLGNEETVHWSVKYYENAGYDVKRIVLIDKEWNNIGTVSNQSNMFFISSRDFWYSKSSGAKPRKLPAAITRAEGIRFYGDGDMNISIKTESPPSEIFYWIEATQ